MSDKSSIGVFDSGLGGLTVLGELQRNFPQENFIYLGDMARTPYGPKGKDTIIRYSIECANFLTKENIKLLIVACNTSTSHALDALKAFVKCPVIGTIEGAVRTALTLSKSLRIGIIGTEATIGSKVYEQNIQRLMPQALTFSLACPLFVPLVEQGMFSGEIVEKVIDLYLGKFKELEIDSLILGCTHYPLLVQEIQEYLGKDVKIVECSKAIAQDIQMLFDQNIIVKNEILHGESTYFVTDAVERFNVYAPLFLSHQDVKAIASARRVEISDF